MKQAESLFLKVADELNISKVARELFMTQQGLSKQIRALEEELGYPLFYRRPKLTLTPYGEALKRGLTRIRIVEEGLRTEFCEIRNESVGTIRFGIHFTRARVILPQIYSLFHKMYPGVVLSLTYEESPSLVRKLLSGELDVMFGVNASPGSDWITKEDIASERIFIVMHDRLIRSFFGEKADAVMADFSRNGADVRLINGLPFISNDSRSQSQYILDRYLLENGINFDISLRSTDHYGNVLLAGDGFQACCCPQSLLHAAYGYNLHKPAGERLHAYPIKGLPASLRMSLLYNRESFFPGYMQAFIDITKEVTVLTSTAYKDGIG